MTIGSEYDEDYYINGVKSKKSLYENYRYLANLTKTMVRHIADQLDIEMDDRILDFGAARGYVVRAFIELGYDAHGLDVSRWAIENCDEIVRDRLALYDGSSKLSQHDWIISKDTLEHVPSDCLDDTLRRFASAARKGVFIVVPLSQEVNGLYVVAEYEKDITHKIRWPMQAWLRAIERAFGQGWIITYQYRMEGVKDNYAQWPKGNGFITIKRLRIRAED